MVVTVAYSLAIYFWALRVCLTTDKINQMMEEVMLPEEGGMGCNPLIHCLPTGSPSFGPREPASLAGVSGLDVTMLHEHVLCPLLGIDHRDPRLQFIPDVRGVGASTRDCDADGGVLFTLHAPSIEDLVSVAERREVMSTKTTYVQPKPHTGIFLS